MSRIYPLPWDKWRCLADKSTRQILMVLKDGPQRPSDLAKGHNIFIARPTISAHLAMLLKAGLVTVEGEGTSRWYSLSREGVREVYDELRELMDGVQEEDYSQGSH